MVVDRAEVQRLVERLLTERFGMVAQHRVAGASAAKQGALPELDTDPDAPATGALVYCIADNGAGKREVRARFPTGSPQTIATEP